MTASKKEVKEVKEERKKQERSERSHCTASATDVKLTLLLCLKIFTVSECQNTIIQIHKDEYFNAKLVL